MLPRPRRQRLQQARQECEQAFDDLPGARVVSKAHKAVGRFLRHRGGGGVLPGFQRVPGLEVHVAQEQAEGAADLAMPVRHGVLQHFLHMYVRHQQSSLVLVDLIVPLRQHGQQLDAHGVVEALPPLVALGRADLLHLRAAGDQLASAAALGLGVLCRVVWRVAEERKGMRHVAHDFQHRAHDDLLITAEIGAPHLQRVQQQLQVRMDGVEALAVQQLLADDCEALVKDGCRQEQRVPWVLLDDGADDARDARVASQLRPRNVAAFVALWVGVCFGALDQEPSRIQMRSKTTSCACSLRSRCWFCARSGCLGSTRSRNARRSCVLCCAVAMLSFRVASSISSNSTQAPMDATFARRMATPLLAWQ
eukprot:scaffold3504_cov240-Pinguiococcus_pyrenoidosus.AAC.53